MGLGRIVLFIVAATAAAGAGIGIAELQKRYSVQEHEQVTTPLTSPAAPAEEASAQIGQIGKMWVISDRLDVRSCPSPSCGLSTRLYYREAAEVVEIRAGWGRISRYIDAMCSRGRTSDLKGNNACTPENGFIDGRYAQWTALDYLSSTRPPDPRAKATGLSKLVAQSDDFRLHEAAFIKAAQRLIEAGTCTEADFLEMGGWMSSPDKPSTYFTYCGGISRQNRYYLNVLTGRIFQ